MYKLSEEALYQHLYCQGASKTRSSETHDEAHWPLLRAAPTDAPIHCLLLGCSMLERFKTTGRETPFGAARFPHVFNAGVGGDRVRNVIYRLGTKGLYRVLRARGVGFAVLQMGTNDVKKTKALDAEAVEQYTVVLEAVRRMAREGGIRIVVSGILPRADTEQRVIDESNAKLRLLVEQMNEEQEERTREEQNRSAEVERSTKATPLCRVYYMPPVQEITLEHLEVTVVSFKKIENPRLTGAGPRSSEF
jgi:hypothetical protein